MKLLTARSEAECHLVRVDPREGRHVYSSSHRNNLDNLVYLKAFLPSNPRLDPRKKINHPDRLCLRCWLFAVDKNKVNLNSVSQAVTLSLTPPSIPIPLLSPTHPSWVSFLFSASPSSPLTFPPRRLSKNRRMLPEFSCLLSCHSRSNLIFCPVTLYPP